MTCIILTFSYKITVGVIIVSSPVGTPVSGFTNAFDYPILSSVTLTCMVNPTPSSAVTYRWNTAGCYTNNQFTNNIPVCFPHGETTQSVTDDDVNAAGCWYHHLYCNH